MNLRISRKKLTAAIVILAVVGGLAWHAKPFLARHYVAQLSQADEAGRESWVASVVGLDEAAVPALLAALEQAEEKSSENLEFALIGLTKRWGPGDVARRAFLRKWPNASSYLAHGARTVRCRCPSHF